MPLPLLIQRVRASPNFTLTLILLFKFSTRSNENGDAMAAASHKHHLKNQAGTALRRPRRLQPTAPKPIRNIAQVAGSGATLIVRVEPFRKTSAL
jgi:hypothetical protein